MLIIFTRQNFYILEPIHPRCSIRLDAKRPISTSVPGDWARSACRLPRHCSCYQYQDFEVCYWILASWRKTPKAWLSCVGEPCSQLYSNSNSNTSLLLHRHCVKQPYPVTYLCSMAYSSITIQSTEVGWNYHIDCDNSALFPLSTTTAHPKVPSNCLLLSTMGHRRVDKACQSSVHKFTSIIDVERNNQLGRVLTMGTIVNNDRER